MYKINDWYWIQLNHDILPAKLITISEQDEDVLVLENLL